MPTLIPMRKTIGMLTFALATTACSSSSGGGEDLSGNVTDRECRPLTAIKSSASAAQSPFTGTVFTIVIENKSRHMLLDASNAPFLANFAANNAVSNGYVDTGVHPSEPNYIWMVSGQNFGILDNDAPVAHHIATTSHLVDQLEKVGKTWKSYQESMGTPCKVVSSGTYAVKHNPFVFFDDLVSWNGTTPTPSQRCIDNVVDYSEFDADLASGNVADYVFITPNMISDMHDGTVKQGDNWLANEVPKILASDAYKNGGVLIITADEGEGQGDDPPFILASPLGKKGMISDVSYDTSSYLKTVQAIMGVEALPCGGDNVAAIPTMGDLFTVPLPTI